ncbi:MAG: DUF2852 domain-containing protein [Alphaproteobacteria bacterium]|nr:DUF2852 domain-containing protein [Alphaproteobacteria bacterium]
MSDSQNKEKFTKYKGQSNWTFPNIAFMVGGFVIAAPVGIATAAWLALGKDVNIGRTIKNTYDEYSPIAKEKFDDLKGSWSHKGNNPDNAAYQAYKAEKQAEYTEETKQRENAAKTEEQQFNDYMAWQKHAKDEASFADFQAHKKNLDEKSDKE